MNPKYLITIYIAVTLLPLGVSWVGTRPARSVLDELASGAGMLAFAIILAEFVLSGRFRSISGKIGMDVTMRFHQLFARTALLLAILHPFLYRLPFARQLPWDQHGQFTLQTDLGYLASGMVAWVLLAVLVAMGIGRASLDYRYETWRLMHGIGAALIAMLLLHHTLNVRSYDDDPLLAIAWVVLFSVAIVSLLYVYAVKPVLQVRQPWIVSSVLPIARKTWEVTVQPLGHRGLTYDAGQFAWLNVGHQPFSLNENPFSISSAPKSGGDLQFVIKELGDFTSSIGQIETGTRAYVDGPHGNLTIEGRTQPAIAMIAGGVGIAPLLGILRQLSIDGDPRPLVLIYANRIEEQIVYRRELDKFGENKGTTIIHLLSEPPSDWTGPTGLVDADFLKRQFGSKEPSQWLFLLCGPPAMIESVEGNLIDLGALPGQILSERFNYD